MLCFIQSQKLIAGTEIINENTKLYSLCSITASQAPDILHTVHLMHCIYRHLDHLEETKPEVMNHFRSAVYGD